MAGAKLRSAKKAAIATIRKALQSNAEVAVLAFEGDCSSPIRETVGFSRNESELITFVEDLSTAGGTPLATALQAANRLMERGKSPTAKTQMVLLLADGADDCGNLEPVLNDLKRRNMLYRHETVGLEVSPDARKQLERIATETGGKYHHADRSELAEVFANVVELTEMLDMLGRIR